MSNLISILCVAPTYHGDHFINKAGKTDAKDFTNVMHRVAEETGLHVEEISLTGNKATERNMLDWYEQQKQKHPKAIVFNYIGHGSRNHQVRWPILKLAHDSHLSSKEFMEKIESVGAKLSLSMIEACNCTGEDNFFQILRGNYDDKNDKKLAKKLKEKEKKQKKKIVQTSAFHKGVSKLFKKSSGTVRIASASPGESAFVARVGSLGEVAFATSLLETCQQGKAASWDHMVQAMKRNLRPSSGQTPLCSAKT